MRGCSESLLCWLVFADCMYSYVSELVYIHSKLMIVDDRRVIVTLFLSSVSPLLTLDDRWDRRTSMSVVKRCDYNDARLSWFLNSS